MLKNKILYAFFHLPRTTKYFLAGLCDFCSLILGAGTALCIRYDVPASIPWRIWSIVIGISSIISVLCFIQMGVYRSIVRYINYSTLIILIAGSLLSTAFMAVASQIAGLTLGWSIPLLYCVFSFLFMAGGRFSVYALGRRHEHTHHGLEVVIYGAGAAGRQLAVSLLSGPDYVPVAFLDDDLALEGAVIMGIRVYSPSSLEFLKSKYTLKKILISIKFKEHDNRKKILKALSVFSVPIYTLPSTTEIISGSIRMENFHEVSITDLLGRDPVQPDSILMRKNTEDKTVLVTGAGGSIGSELCRQILLNTPKSIILLESSEYALYKIHTELNAQIDSSSPTTLYPILGSVQNLEFLTQIMKMHSIHSVYHAAAYKHVPLVESNSIEGILNNVFGTLYTARAAMNAGVPHFVLISTDKAVRPTNVMGASKRIAELILQAFHTIQSKTCFSMVRFGNVANSTGSVIPLFQAQINQGGPVTVTHPDMIRYFMTIPEAAQLVIQAGSMSTGGDVFLLDMGEPVKIDFIARQMIQLMGFSLKSFDNPTGDIEIIYTGIRPGEKLYEELLIGENSHPTSHPRITKAHEINLPLEVLEGYLDKILSACKTFDEESIRRILRTMPLNFKENPGDLSLMLESVVQ